MSYYLFISYGIQCMEMIVMQQQNNGAFSILGYWGHN